jgi:hypothetical protein
VHDIAAGLRLLFELVVIVGFIGFSWFFGLWWIPFVIGAVIAVVVGVVIVQARLNGDA